MDGQYFSRNLTWSMLDGQLVVHDNISPMAPRMVTMEEWHELVFFSADGQHTIGEFVNAVGSKYEGTPPNGLRDQIHNVIGELLDQQIIILHDEAVPLPMEYANEFVPKESIK
ncbi:hypothetical protein FLL45_18505 [Aliikangiella marina]|uniref:PqqD family protein n=1 Tax=Aliikangiella marina TaxID=1712262 RepID=A0A545T4R2_9GAMM|nr:hypothetical protein [Aliikangiella marina]TQV72211.1 hypothetical protein FLL45_18505 [Aliikangiella marina]